MSNHNTTQTPTGGDDAGTMQCYKCGKAFIPSDACGWLSPLIQGEQTYVIGDPIGTLRCTGHTGECLKQGKSKQRADPAYDDYLKAYNATVKVVIF